MILRFLILIAAVAVFVLPAAVIVVQALAPTVEARDFKKALPGYRLQFPADHRSHNEYKTEWWYYTGHLLGDDGTKYGYELTFFRSAMDVPRPPKPSAWLVDNAYLAHFAVSDITGKRFFHTSRLNRSAYNMAGADQKRLNVWNGNWKVSRDANGQMKLFAQTPDYTVDLTLTSPKPPVLHGREGLSQKASCAGCASYYYSLTRMETKGTITKNGGKSIPVSGLTWMDHEFGSNQLTPEQVGWDWFSVQLDDQTELMLYLMRKRDGKLDENSSGTFVFANATAKHLNLSDYKVTATGFWRSPHSGATYPMGWKVSIPSQHIDLQIQPEMLDQELFKRTSTDVTYWEGTCVVSGNKEGKPAKGQAYVEMTGYAENFNKGI